MNIDELLALCYRQKIEVVAIGTSAGGVDAFSKLLPAFQKPSPLRVLAVIHLSPDGPNLIPSLFEDRCSFAIKEAEPGEKVLKETIYISAPDYHLHLEKKGLISLCNDAPVNFARPSIDVLFESVAHSAGSKALGILLTGANEDGAKGLKTIKNKGGLTIVQDPKSAESSIMPNAALSIMQPHLIMDLEGIQCFIKTLSNLSVKE